MERSRLARPPVELLQSGVVINPEAIPDLRAQFEETGIALLPGFFSAPVVNLIMKQVRTTDLKLRNEVMKATGDVFGTTRKAELTEPVVVGLSFLLNRGELFQLAADVAGIRRPGCFLCRLHRTEAVPGQHIDWHDDAVDGRILGLDICLSAESYEGGLFQIRSPDKKVRREVLLAEPGDAFLFRIGDRWQHRLTPVTSGARTVAVGWFREGPDWSTLAPGALLASKLLYSGKTL
jgi:hypothetical protein